MDKNKNQVEKEDKELCLDLQQVGINVNSVYDLLRYPRSYTIAYPILATWLPKASTLLIKEGIIRALTIKKLDTILVKALLQEFHTLEIEKKEYLRWVIGNAIYIINRTDEFYIEIVSIIKEQAFGKSREMFVLALGNSKKTEALELLLDLLNNVELNLFAISALGKFGNKDVIRYVEKFLNYPKANIRNEAKKTIKKLSNK